MAVAAPPPSTAEAPCHPAGMHQLLRGVHQELGNRLEHLSRAIQQLACEPWAAGEGAAAQVAAEQDAVLSGALQAAAARIRDFQRSAEHRAQELQLEAALAPLRKQHAAALSCLTEQLDGARAELDALQQRLAESEAAGSAAAQSATQWEQRAAASQRQAQAATEERERAAAEFRDALASAERRSGTLEGELSQVRSDAAATAARLQQELVEQAAAAGAAAAERAAAQNKWETERLQLNAAQQDAQAAWEQERKALRLQCAEAQQQAAAEGARAASAELAAADLRLREQQLCSELEEAVEKQGRLQGEVQAAREVGAGLASRLQAAEDGAAAARRLADEGRLQLEARVQEQAARLAADEERHSRQEEALKADLEQERAGHAACCTLLSTLRRQSAEQQHLLSAAESAAAAERERLNGEVGSYRRRAELLDGRVEEMQAAAVAAEASAAAQAEAAAAAAGALRRQLAHAQRAAELALEEAAKEWLNREAEVQLVLATHKEKVAEAKATAAAQLAGQLQEAAAELAARKGELQQRLSSAAEQFERELRRQRQAECAAAAAREARWDELCDQVAARLAQLAGLLHCTLEGAQPAVQDAEPGPSPAIDTAAQQPPPLPPAMEVVHHRLAALHRAALCLHSRHADSLAQLALLRRHLAATSAAAEDGQRAAEQRRRQELKLLDANWEGRCGERVAAAEAAGRAALAATEDRLQAELAQLAARLSSSLGSNKGLQQRCAELLAEVAAVQAAAECSLDAAGERARQAAAGAAAAAAAAAEQAAQRQAAAEEALRGEMVAAVEQLKQEHGAVLAAAAEQRAQEAEEACQRATHTAAAHRGELLRADEAWRQRWAAEAARLERMRSQALAMADADHRRLRAAAEERHGEEASYLREALSRLESSERQLLSTRAMLEAKLAEASAAATAAADAHAAELAEARLAAEAAAAGPLDELKLQVSELEGQRGGLLAEVAQLRDRLGREARPQDLAAIAELEGQVAEARREAAAAQQRCQRLRRELLLREDTYNKTFAMGGAPGAMGVGAAAAAPASLTSWMIKAAPGPGARRGGGSMSAAKLPALPRRSINGQQGGRVSEKG